MTDVRGCAEMRVVLDEIARKGARPRTVMIAAGGIEIEAPRVNDKRVGAATGERCGFKSSIVPPWCRNSPKVAEMLPADVPAGTACSAVISLRRSPSSSEARPG